MKYCKVCLRITASGLLESKVLQGLPEDRMGNILTTSLKLKGNYITSDLF